MTFPSFIKALVAYFDQPKLTIPEMKALTSQDKLELSDILNKVPGFDHPPYEIPVAN